MFLGPGPDIVYKMVIYSTNTLNWCFSILFPLPCEVASIETMHQNLNWCCWIFKEHLCPVSVLVQYKKRKFDFGLNIFLNQTGFPDQWHLWGFFAFFFNGEWNFALDQLKANAEKKYQYPPPPKKKPLGLQTTKILEQVITWNICKHVENNGVISRSQDGFAKNKPC